MVLPIWLNPSDLIKQTPSLTHSILIFWPDIPGLAHLISPLWPEPISLPYLASLHSPHGLKNLD